MTKEVEYEFLNQCKLIGIKPNTKLKTLFVSGVNFGLDEAYKINARVFAKKGRT